MISYKWKPGRRARHLASAGSTTQGNKDPSFFFFFPPPFSPLPRPLFSFSFSSSSSSSSSSSPSSFSSFSSCCVVSFSGLYLFIYFLFPTLDRHPVAGFIQLSYFFVETFSFFRSCDFLLLLLLMLLMLYPLISPGKYLLLLLLLLFHLIGNRWQLESINELNRSVPQRLARWRQGGLQLHPNQSNQADRNQISTCKFTSQIIIIIIIIIMIIRKKMCIEIND